MTKKTKQRGRPVKNVIPPVDTRPEGVAVAIMQAPPKKDWQYLKKNNTV